MHGSADQPDLPSVNYLTPGATHVWVGVPFSVRPTTGPAPVGTIKIGSAAPTTLTWVKNELPQRARWESNFRPIGTATTVSATVTVTTPSGTNPATQTVTYTKAA